MEKIITNINNSDLIELFYWESILEWFLNKDNGEYFIDNLQDYLSDSAA
jgi:hypothetical protein